jgi:hypothetical protein
MGAAAPLDPPKPLPRPLPLLFQLLLQREEVQLLVPAHPARCRHQREQGQEVRQEVLEVPRDQWPSRQVPNALVQARHRPDSLSRSVKSQLLALPLLQSMPLQPVPPLLPPLLPPLASPHSRRPAPALARADPSQNPASLLRM